MNFEQHLSHLKMVFDKFRPANLRMNGKKCNFAVEQVKYLGHILSADGVTADPSKTDIITNWPRPKNAKQVKSFLGVTNYYRRFLARYSQRSAALRELTAKDKPFDWGDKQEDAFNDLKTALSRPPILRYPDTNRDFYLETDASGKGVSFLLGQSDEEGNKYVVSYGGRGLRPCERKWPITQLECLALLTGIRENHIYLASRPFTVYTDYISLKYLETLKVSANYRLARWAFALQPYKFVINYKEGKKLTAADGISRRPFAEPTSGDIDEVLAEDSYIAAVGEDVVLTDETACDASATPRRWTEIHFEYEADEELMKLREHSAEIKAITDLRDEQDIEHLQRQCPDFIPIFDYIEQRKLPTDDKAARKLILESENFVIEHGVLYHTFSPRSKRLDKMTPIVHQLCVPRERREHLLRAYVI